MKGTTLRWGRPAVPSTLVGPGVTVQSDLIRARTREGMQVAKAKGRLRGKQPKLSNAQQRHVMEIHDAGTHSTAEIAELFNVARSTVYRTIERQLSTKH